MWLFAAFVAVPLIEIALFISVGGWIGLWPTLLIVIVTALIGTALVRSQGAQAMRDLRSSLDRLSDPTEPLAHGAMILFSGALLLTPGFFTDAVGFLLLVPGVRVAVLREARKRVRVERFAMGGGAGPRPGPRPGPGFDPRPPRGAGPDDRVIEGEWEEVTPRRPTHRPSGWTQH
ncbi:FxsA family protein [Wenxinia saemankumensis]|uniref:UPF0716 protein FxsA n=1 Tax=Wenxinia saemankumensis TaxID=1447782 RepID=A0A1M6G292_9RHOB|nr:FxsA family protein [Wenxinia saemankumensis]SHJ04111.1 UPF0716 protein FxsA [Wenxinia saemankumensis]